MKQIMRIAAVLLLTTLGLSAQVISDIVIQAEGDLEVSREVVFSNMQLRIGDPFNPDKLSEDIRQLYGTGQFANIIPDVQTDENGRIRLILTFEAKPIIRDIHIRGNDRIKDKRLRRELEQETGQPLDDATQSKDLAALYSLYNDRGYNDVQIDQQIDPVTDSNQVDIVYIIAERGRAKTRGINIVGNHALSNRQVKRVMETGVSFWGRLGFPAGFFSADEYADDIDRIRNLYWNQGYLDVQVRPETVRFSSNGKKAYVTVTIEEGQPYTIASLTIEGNEQFSHDELAAATETQAGMTYSRQRELDDLRALEAFYNKHGYLNVRTIETRQADSESHTVDIAYRIQEGVPATIRNVEITGNTITYDNVIRRELIVGPGDLGDMTAIRASRQRLLNLGYFEEVNVVPVPTDDPSIYDLRINVVEGATGQLSFGAGFSSASDVSAQFELAQTNFALDNPPFFRGGGQRLSFRTSIGSESQSFSINFTEPWLFDQRLRLNTQLWRTLAQFSRGWDEEGTGAMFRLTEALPWQYWSHSLGYRIENVDISDIDPDYSQAFITENEGDHLVSSLMYGVTRTDIDRYPVPNYGSKLEALLELQAQAIGSYSDIYKLSLGATQYLPVFQESVVKFEISYNQVDALSGDDPKVFDRLFAGGLNSIRGFDHREVGPYDPRNSEPVGGSSRLLASVELLKPLYQEIVYGAIFADAGDVWADPWDIKPGEINVGAGMGVRIFIMRGLGLQIDYGWPVRREQDNLDDSGRLHFTIGYSF